MRRFHARPVPAVPSSAFKGFRFPPEIIVLAVRWYLRYGLSYRDVEEFLAERGIEVDHVTVFRWVQRFTPLLVDAARPCRHAVGDRWFVDETYVKVAGRWRYVYRAVDQYGQIIDVYVSAKRDIRAARRLFIRALGAHGEPVEIVTDRGAGFAGRGRRAQARRSKTWSGTRTIGSKPITGDSRHGSGRCGDSNATTLHAWSCEVTRSCRTFGVATMNSASTRAAIGASRPRSRNSPGSYNEKRTAARSYAARSNSTQQSPANSSPAACPTASAAEGVGLATRPPS